MKKRFTHLSLLFVALFSSLNAIAQTVSINDLRGIYTGSVDVAMDFGVGVNIPVGTEAAEVISTVNEGTLTLNLKNFTIAIGDAPIEVGDIEINNIQVDSEGNVIAEMVVLDKTAEGLGMLPTTIEGKMNTTDAKLLILVKWDSHYDNEGMEGENWIDIIVDFEGVFTPSEEPFVPVAPQTPINLQSSRITQSGFHLNWAGTESADEYRITAIHMGDNSITELIVVENSAIITNLEKGSKYLVAVYARLSAYELESETPATTTLYTNLDFGDQMKNGGFEEWESVTTTGQEPIHWNSFLTVGGSLAGTARGDQLKPSSIVRNSAHGSTSAIINSRSVIGVVANGNLTNGRINAGSLSASGSSNYNYSDLNDANHHQTISCIPDSATVWVYYDKKGTREGEEARASFIIHGDDQTDLSKTVREPHNTQPLLVSAVADLNYSTHGEWVRLSIPFAVAEQTDWNQPKYILASFTTNKTPGRNSGSHDNILIDDIVMIYKPTVTVADPTLLTYAPGDEITVSFTLTGTMSPSNLDAAPNEVILQLSDLYGNFNTEFTILGEPIQTDESGEIIATLPTELPESNLYRVRVVTTNYPMISASNETDIVIADVATGIEHNTALNRLKLYPNPAKNQIQVTGSEVSNFRILDIAGKIIIASSSDIAQGIDVSMLPAGIYFIELNTNLGREVLRFIKE